MRSFYRFDYYLTTAILKSYQKIQNKKNKSDSPKPCVCAACQCFIKDKIR